MLVWTTKGYIERERLKIEDRVIEHENVRRIVSTYYLDGEQVREDISDTAWRPLTARGN